MKFLSPFFLLAIFLCSSVCAQNLDHSNLSEKIDALVPEAINDTTPGLVVGIIQKGELIFSKGYGLANLSYGIPNDPKMLYNIGSVSKQFLGYAFAMIEAKGLIDLDDPAGKFLDDWPEFEHEVTVRHLLSHSSGYREAYAMSELAGRIPGIDRISKEECLNVVRRQKELEFVPGSRFTYNSTAWVILAEIFTEVMKEPADIWISQNIFDPLKMKNSRIENQVGEVFSNTAESYSYDGESYINSKSNRAIFAAADIFSSIEDLVKWINNLRDFEMGGEKTKDTFLETLTLNDGSDSKYALGIGVREYRGLKVYSHNGGHAEFRTQLRYFPEYDTGIIFISNFGGQAWIPASEIADLLLEQHMTAAKNAEQKTGEFELELSKLKSFEGVFLTEDKHKSVRMTVKDGLLNMEDEFYFKATSANTFVSEDGSIELQFSKSTTGKSEVLVIGRFRTSYQKIEEWSTSSTDLDNFQGDYWSDELETVYHLEVEENQLKMQHRWNESMILEPLGKDVFKSDWGYYLVFSRNEKNEITGFSVSAGRTLNVFFTLQ